MRIRTLSANAPSPVGLRVLVADDDARFRSLVATLLRQAAGVSSVLEAKDGAQAVQLGRDLRVHATVLDLNMPRVDGVEAALMLRSLQPSMRIALHSSDPESLRARAGGLGLPLFDKIELERLIEWVDRQPGSRSSEASLKVATLARRVELHCSRCGYGIVSRTPPAHCPMCRTRASWAEPSQGVSQSAAL